MPKNNQAKILVFVFVLVLALMAVTMQAQAQTADNGDVIDPITELVESSGKYSFIAQVEQTLIPRAIGANIGRTEERVDTQITGEVTLPDKAVFDLQFEGNSELVPFTIEQDGPNTYLIQGEERTQIENPLSPTITDFVGYLHAAENIRTEENPEQPQLTVYQYDINGTKFAAYLVDVMRRQLPPEEQGAPLQAPAVVEQMSGQGELWVDADGYPVRQIIDVFTPEANEQFDVQSHFVVDFNFQTAVTGQPLLTAENIPAAAATGESNKPAPLVDINPIVGLKSSLENISLSSLLGTVLISIFVIIFVVNVARSHRWLRRTVPVGIVILFVLTPILRPISEARAQENTRSPERLSLNEALGMEETGEESEGSQNESVNSFQMQPNVPVEQQPLVETTTCGEGSTSDDSDSDGLNDFVEICLGTDPNYFDTDEDGITDTLEVNGFVFTNTMGITQTFYTNPLSADSNEDGLTDDQEWAAPIGGAASQDIDGDNLPNLWDDDNDGDGVPDNVDIDPFSTTDFNADFSLRTSLNGSSYNGFEYINFQVQPQNEDHFRLALTKMDWPYDDVGSIQARDVSNLEELTFTPMLRITANVAPYDNMQGPYGLAVEKKGGKYEMQLLLVPVSDGGRITAFQGRMAYGRYQLNDINLSKIEFVWVAYMDASQPDGSTRTIPVAEYAESAFRITGLEITKSDEGEYAVLGTPGSQTNHQPLANLLMGLEASFLSSTTTDFDEVVSRFSNPATPITQTWGVPAADVAVGLPQFQPLHMDDMFMKYSSSAQTIRDFLQANGYNQGQMASVITIIEAKTGSQSLDTLNSINGNQITVNLADIPLFTMRSVNLSHFTYKDNLWGSPSDVDALNTLIATYENDPDAVLTSLQTTYPDIKGEELMTLFTSFYLMWMIGQVRFIDMDGVQLVKTTVDDADITNQYYLPGVTDFITYVIEAAHLALPGAGLVFNDPQTYYQYRAQAVRDAQQGQNSTSYALGLTYTIGKALWDGWYVWEIIAKVKFQFRSYTYKYVSLIKKMLTYRSRLYKIGNLKVFGFRVLKPAAYLAKLMPSSTRTLALVARTITYIRYVATAVLFVVSIVLIWVQYAKFSSPYGYERQQALAYAITDTVLTIVLLIMGFFGFLIIFTFLLVVANLVALLLSSIAGEPIDNFVTRALTSLVVSFDADTKVEHVDFEGLDVSANGSGYFLAGSKVTLADVFNGRIAGYLNEIEKLYGSDIYGTMDARAGVNITASSGNDVNTNRYRCNIGGSTKYCSNKLWADFTFANAGRDQKVEIFYKITAITKYTRYNLGGLIATDKTDTLYMPDELKEEDRWSWMPVYLDILPNTIDGLLNWSELKNNDLDGDGVDNITEAVLSTIPPTYPGDIDGDGKINGRDWDRDGDGLSDGFEADSQNGSGSDPNIKDTDNDGLVDGEEFWLGTSIGVADTDSDGLTDGEEQFHWDGSAWSGGGWTVTIDGVSYWVFANPFVADWDGDGISDASEKANGTSPYSFNDAPRLELLGGPLVEREDGIYGVYVAAGDAVTTSLSLYNTAGIPITTTLSLCLPPSLTNVNVTASGDRVPTTQVNGDCFDWDFSGNNLLAFQRFNVDVSALAGNSSYSTTLSADLPFAINGTPQPLSAQIRYVEDNTVPTIQITNPMTGTILNSQFYVVGGFAQDADSWIDTIQVTVPSGTYSATLEDSRWGYTWDLPDDGVVNVSAVATDIVGNASAPFVVQVTVDTLAPVISINLAEGATVSAGESYSTTVPLSGTVTDNFAGLARIQLRYNEGPWRTIWDDDAHPLAANWDGLWELPTTDTAQGAHNLYLRAYDAFGNIGYLTRTVFIDVLPPTNDLTNQAFVQETPKHVPGGQPVPIYGVASDAGNNPLPADPSDLSGNLNSISDATIWLQVDNLAENDGGVYVTWLGDNNGDRLGDLAVGLPAANGGTGKVVVINGSPGGWPVPNIGDLEFLKDNTPSFVGTTSAGVGSIIKAAGDVNGDGVDDMLVGDPANERLLLVLGSPASSVFEQTLDGSYPHQIEIVTENPDQLLSNLTAVQVAGVGDVTNDGLSDIMVSMTGVTTGVVYLLAGDSSIGTPQTLNNFSAAVLPTGPGGASVAGVGDVNDDFIPDFAVAMGNTVYLFAGGGGWVQAGLTTLSTANAIATFATSDSLPTIVGAGDLNGDNIDDFAFTSGSSPVVVYGNGSQSFTTQTLGGFASPLSGFLAAVGDVDKDGRTDLLIGNADEDAYLLSGADLTTAAATIEGVAEAASTPYVAGADLAGDGSSDLALVPTAAAASDLGYDGFVPQSGQAPFISRDSLPVIGGSSAAVPGLQTEGFRPTTNGFMTGDATVGPVGADFTSIQDAIDSGADRVLIQPGIYAEAITLTNNVSVIGSGADRTILTFPGGGVNTTLVTADGITNTAVMNLTLLGSGSGTGVAVSNSADSVRLERVVVQGMATAVSVDGSATTLALKNNSILGNADGFLATNNAGVDIRNTIFAYNTGTAVQYDPGAVLTLHQYNLYYANGTDLSPNNPGGGEKFSNPLFLNYGLGDFRTEPFSPVIDAGTPNDPVPPGAGSAIDIGHLEQSSNSFFADDDYCDVCLNDGLIWGVDAFATIQEAVDAAQFDIDNLQLETPIQFSVGVNGGVYTESVVISTSIQLVGQAPDQTTIVGNGGPAVTFQSAVNAGVSGFTLIGGGSDSIGVLMNGGSNTIAIDYNLIKNNTTGISVTERSTGNGTFNTIISNTTGVQLARGVYFNTYEVFPGPLYPRIMEDSCPLAALMCEERGYLWLDLTNSIISHNAVGLSAIGKSVLFSDNNLLFNTIDYNNVISGSNDIVGLDPMLTGPYGYLQAGSPALDQAPASILPPPGGGLQADLGWHELLAAPISIFMGQPDESIATESIGVGQVEYAIVPVASLTMPVTATLPVTWTLATLNNPGEKLTYWQTSYNAAADGYYRVYSRATDVLGNTETDVEDWYDGAFAVDSLAPVVTMTISTYDVNNWVLLQAEVIDYVGTSFDIKDIYFTKDGERLDGRWAVEEWTADGVSPRTFRYLFQNNTGMDLINVDFQAIAVDGAGNIGSSPIETRSIPGQFSNQWIDTIPVREITITTPLPGTYVSETVYFSGMTWDNGAFFSPVFEEHDSKTAGIELSFDGGVTWVPTNSWIPGLGDPDRFIADRKWDYTWTVPAGFDATTFPVRVRAIDHAGNFRSEIITVTLDTAPPRPFTPEFNLPEGIYMDQGELVIGTWGPSPDGSGWVTATSVIEHPDGSVTLYPNDYQVENSGSEGIPVGFTFGVRDEAENVIYNHYGDWKGGDVAVGPDWAGFQYLERDGFMDISHNEWLTDTEFLDNDERAERVQSLWTTWDSYSAYIGWQGASWGPDGTLWVYFDLFADGTNVGIDDGRQLPFEADFAVNAIDSDTALFWHYDTGTTSWISETLTTPDINPYQPGYSHTPDRQETEIRALFLDYLNFGTTENVDWSRMFAYTVSPEDEVTSAFPTVNALDEPFSYYFEWNTAADPFNYLQLPTAVRQPAVSLSFASDPPVQDTVSNNDTISYVATISTLEDEDEPGIQMVVSGTAALAYQSVTGAAAYDCSAVTICTIDLPTIPAGEARVVTITAQTISDLTGFPEIYTSIQLQTALPLPETNIVLTNPIDITPPYVTVNLNPGYAIGTGQQTITGEADDGPGAGVAYVEVSTDGVNWQVADGTQSWSAVITTPPGPYWPIHLRATDYHNQTSIPVATLFAEDTTAPILNPTVPGLLGGSVFGRFTGTTYDPAPDDAQVALVEMQLDTSGAAWNDGNVYGFNMFGFQNWAYVWALPQEDGVTHTVRFRATDYGNNITTSGWYTTVVDTIAPAVTITQQLTQTITGTAALSGQITDGTAVSQIRVLVYPEVGPGTEMTATLNGDLWSVALAEPLGQYSLYLIAEDIAGNSRLLGPFSVEIIPVALGDVGCDGNLDVIDALYIIQYEVGLRSGTNLCPPAEDELYLPSCDVNGDTFCDVVDALFIMQCEVGIANSLCPSVQPTESQEQGVMSEGASEESPGATAEFEPAIRPSARVTTIRIDSNAIGVGQTVSVPIMVHVPTNNNLTALTVDVAYDPAVIAFESCSTNRSDFNLSMCAVQGSQEEDKDEQVVSITALAVTGTSGELLLGEIVFTGVAPGFSDLSLSNRAFEDGSGHSPRLLSGGIRVRERQE